MVLGPAFPAMARENIGIYGNWGAFRDPMVPRCYAVAKALPSTMRRDYQPYATVGTWPKRKLRNQDFLAKAKPEVVEKEKALLTQLEETLDKLKKAQESLSFKAK